MVWSPITDRFGLRPEGPFFGMFALGAIAMVAGIQADPVVAFLDIPRPRRHRSAAVIRPQRDTVGRRDHRGAVPTELFMARHHAVRVGFFTPLIMSMTELAAPTDPWGMLTDRAVDTLIGVAVGLAIAVLMHEPRPGGVPAFDHGQQEDGSTG